MENIWYVEFPTHRYVEDVKEVARKAGLRIIDAKFQGKNKQCEKAPKLTLKSDGKELSKDDKKFNALILKIDELKEGELKFVSNHIGVEFTEIEETRLKVKEFLGI